MVFVALGAAANNPVIENHKLSFVFNHLIAISDVNITPNKVAEYNQDFLYTVASFKQKKEKWNNDYRTLYHVFYKTHHKYLKEYKPIESFGRMLKYGEYGCLTGTALYALILDELDYNFEIVETNYHVYILIKTEDQEFLFESTDPMYGFYSSEKDINKKLTKDGSNEGKIFKNSIEFTFDLDNRIGLNELIGLQYYNMAVQSYNKGFLIQSISELNEAANYYNSERLKVFLNLILQEFNQEMQDVILEKQEFANLHKIASL